MSFDNLFAKETRVNQCKFSKEYAALDEPDKTLLRTAFADREISTSHIYRVLRANGFTVSDSTIRAHRRGTCQTCGVIA